MKRYIALFAVGLVTLALVACGSMPAQSPSQIAAQVQSQVAKACQVVQPTLLSVQALTAADPVKQAVIGEVIKDNAVVCAGGASIDTTSIAKLVDTSIPAALQVVTLLPVDPAVKTGIQIGLIAFQTALSGALAQYGTPAPAPASGAVSA